MNLNKHLEFFNPLAIEDPIHIIGVGAIGSILAENLVRIGLPKLNIYDFDIVESQNITNQLYLHKHIKQLKVEALEDILTEINPNIIVTKWHKGCTPDQHLTGHVFLCVDSIKTRQKITDKQLFNPYIKTMHDFRMRLTDAQYYAAQWKNHEQKQKFKKSMDFTSEEAKEASPVNACGSTLSIAPTIRTIVATGVANFINGIQGKNFITGAMLDPFNNTYYTW